MPENTVRIDRHMPGIRLDRLVTQRVTEVLNAMLDAEAGELVRASRYERSGGRKAYHAPEPPTCSGARYAGGSELVIVPWTAMTKSTQPFGYYRVLWAFFAYGPPHPALYEKVREGQQHERKGGGREAREKL